MKTLFRDLKSFIGEHFNKKIYISFFILNAILIVFNYSLDFEDSYIDKFRYTELHILLLSAYLAVGYYAMILIQSAIKKNYLVLKSKIFWIKSMFALLVIGFDRGFYYHRDILSTFPPETITFIYKCLNNLLCVLTVFLPIWLFYLLFDRKKKLGFYGLRTKNAKLKPFFSIFYFIIPLVLLSAIFTEMGQYYPMYSSTNAGMFKDYFNISELITIISYEIAYGINFIGVELAFRGLLIIGFIKILGKDAILPMVTAYSILHFGKPLPETISSIFGGYALAVFAYKYKHIWAGIILHIGLAWLMELFGWLF